MSNRSNAGKVWDKRDLLLLDKLMKECHRIGYVANMLGRSPEACDMMYREIRRMDMMRNGGLDDNLRSWTKKLQDEEQRQ